jgi:putative methionine-R-sulfoxide reductase with GAF domain
LGNNEKNKLKHMNKDNAQRNTVIHALLKNETTDWQEVLSTVISAFDCTTGTIHFLDEKSGLLKVQAHQGIPPFLIPKLSEIPIGKGMAGIAAERREPVEMCNLQTDDSGVARPAAKETKVEGSIAAPMILNGKLYGTLGIAKPIPYDFTKEEVSDLLAIGEKISEKIST